jgi:Cytosol aminopeptidase family, N-terminal domain
MRTSPVARLLTLIVMATFVLCLTGNDNAAAQSTIQAAGSAATKPREIAIADAPIPIRILVQSPAETDAELQIICLFRSDPSNTLHGSLVEANEKLKGLLDRIRKPTLFRGELGETLLIDPPAGSLAAKRLLIIGLGDSETFTPERMELVGAIAYREASRLGVARPFFAPTVIDGGVTTSAAGEVAEQFIRGFLRAAHTERVVQEGGASRGPVIQELTFLAGPQRAADAQKGIENAIAVESGK